MINLELLNAGFMIYFCDRVGEIGPLPCRSGKNFRIELKYTVHTDSQGVMYIIAIFYSFALNHAEHEI